MKNIKIYIATLFSLFVLSGQLVQAQNTKPTTEKKGWSKKAKGAVIEGATGATHEIS